MGFVHITGGRIGCCDDLVFAVNGPVHLVGKLGFSPVHQRCIRVGSGDIAVVLFFMGSGRFGTFGKFFQTGLELFIVLMQLMFQILGIEHRIIGGVRLHQAGIDEDLPEKFLTLRSLGSVSVDDL